MGNRLHWLASMDSAVLLVLGNNGSGLLGVDALRLLLGHACQK